jgi:hypothetical protein
MRRINQCDAQGCGLEELAFPVAMKVNSLLQSLGAPGQMEAGLFRSDIDDRWNGGHSSHELFGG